MRIGKLTFLGVVLTLGCLLTSLGTAHAEVKFLPQSSNGSNSGVMPYCEGGTCASTVCPQIAKELGTQCASHTKATAIKNAIKVGKTYSKYGNCYCVNKETNED